MSGEPLKGRVVLVTGGGGGIGSVIATEMAGLGAEVIVVGRRRHLLEAVCDASDRMTPLPFDVCSEAEWQGALEDVGASLGPVDVLVTSAATIKRAMFLDSDIDDWMSMWRTNVLGTMLGARAVLPGMLDRQWGRVILVSSTVAAVGVTHRTGYTATKGAVEAFGRALAAEVAGSGVTVNTLAPGAFRTEINADLLVEGSAASERVLRSIPEGRYGDPRELAHAVRFLIESGYCQGQTIRVDGGWAIQG